MEVFQKEKISSAVPSQKLYVVATSDATIHGFFKLLANVVPEKRPGCWAYFTGSPPTCDPLLVPVPKNPLQVHDII